MAMNFLLFPSVIFIKGYPGRLNLRLGLTFFLFLILNLFFYGCQVGLPGEEFTRDGENLSLDKAKDLWLFNR